MQVSRFYRSSVILITLKKKINLHVKLTLLTKLTSSSYKLALLIHQDMCLIPLCPTRGPVEGFVQASLGCSCSESILHTDNQFLF